MSVLTLALAGAASLQLAVASVALSDPSSVASGALDSLATETAHRTARYADRRAATADGYRRIGTDFPGMGEHWLHSGALIAGRVDAARPTLLSYVTMAGKPTLVGVGFVITTRGEGTTPDVPGWPEHWHEHSGLLADESGAGVGRAFSLAVGGRRYLEAVLADAGLLHDANRTGVQAALDSASASAERISRSAQAAGAVGLDEALALRAVWRSLGDTLRALCGPAVDAIMLPKHGH